MEERYVMQMQHTNPVPIREVRNERLCHHGVDVFMLNLGGRECQRWSRALCLAPEYAVPCSLKR